MRGHDHEPQLDELFNDPMMQALMESDGTDAATVMTLLTEARDRYAAPSRPRR